MLRRPHPAPVAPIAFFAMPRFKLTIEYDGRPFVGWQAQDNGPSVQATLTEAIEAFCGQRVQLTAAGRTDAGVHARGQVADLMLDKPWAPDRVRMASNHHLGQAPIAVLSAEPVADAFSARFDAVQRFYTYRIVNRRGRLGLDRGLAWHLAAPLDPWAMHQAAQHLVGRHDFTTFRHVHCQAKSPIKTIDLIQVEAMGEEIRVHVAARSFLHHQVRSIVGCLSLVGRGKWRAADMKAALEARDRSALGLNAPPDGLYFMRVVYGPSRLAAAAGGETHGSSSPPPAPAQEG